MSILDEDLGHVPTPDNFSDAGCRRLLEDLDASDHDLSEWEMEFIDSCLGRESYSPKQKRVILDMARKHKLI